MKCDSSNKNKADGNKADSSDKAWAVEATADEAAPGSLSSPSSPDQPLSPRRRRFKRQRARRAVAYATGLAAPTPSVDALVVELNAEDERRHGPREVRRWCVCPGCGSPFIAFRLSGDLMPGIERLRAGVGSERWDSAPVCSSACYNLVELLGPFDEALVSAYEAVNSLLGMTISRVVEQMRKARVTVVSWRTRVSDRVGMPHALTEEQVAVLSARTRQLSALMALTRQYGVRKFRGRKPGIKSKPKSP